MYCPSLYERTPFFLSLSHRLRATQRNAKPIRTQRHHSHPTRKSDKVFLLFSQSTFLSRLSLSNTVFPPSLSHLTSKTNPYSNLGTRSCFLFLPLFSLSPSISLSRSLLSSKLGHSFPFPAHLPCPMSHVHVMSRHRTTNPIDRPTASLPACLYHIACYLSFSLFFFVWLSIFEGKGGKNCVFLWTRQQNFASTGEA